MNDQEETPTTTLATAMLMHVVRSGGGIEYFEPKIEIHVETPSPYGVDAWRCVRVTVEAVNNETSTEDALKCMRAVLAELGSVQLAQLLELGIASPGEEVKLDIESADMLDLIRYAQFGRIAAALLSSVALADDERIPAETKKELARAMTIHGVLSPSAAARTFVPEV